MADDNKPLKYMRYAIGEIALVMIGILLALQVNNWNQNRLEKIKEIKILNTLMNDLINAETTSSNLIKTDQLVFNDMEFFLSGKIARQTIINHPKVDSIFNRLIWSSVNTNVPVINSYTDLKNSGRTGIISNDLIRLKFSELETRFNGLDKILQDRLSVQLINIDKFVMNQMNFVPLLKHNKEIFKIDYGVKNDYSTLFNSQFVLNAIGVKLELTNSVLRERKLLLNEIKNSITIIEAELNK